MKKWIYAAMVTSMLSLSIAACGDDKDDDPPGHEDAGIVIDAGTGDDAGITSDAGIGGDAGVISDAGTGDDAGSKCTGDENCDGTASCLTKLGLCIPVGSKCLIHNDCGDTQFCDVSELETVYGKCKTGARPEGLACGERTTDELGEDCASGIAVDISSSTEEVISICSCDCEGPQDCPEIIPKCNEFFFICAKVE